MPINLFFKRTLSFLIVIIFIFCGFTIYGSEDSIDIEAEEELNLLSAIGILPNDSYANLNTSEKICRSDFISYINRMLCLENIYGGNTKVFNDVSEADSYYKDIMNAYVLGIVSGDANGDFNPKAEVTFDEAIKMLVSSLKYKTLAEQKGGYPYGYYIVAKDIGLYKTTDIPADKILTNGIAVKLVFNALNTNYVETGVDGTDLTIRELKNKTYLEKVFNVSRYTGIVTGTKYTKRIEGIEKFDEKIEINNFVYNYSLKNYTDTEQLLGKQIYYYIQYEKGSEDINDAEIIAMNPVKNKNNVITADAENISHDNTISSFTYWNEDDDKRIKLEISREAVIFYNGKRALNIENSDFSQENGDITLIDNNEDDMYDFIMINSYKTYVVQSVTNGVISSKYDDWKIDLKVNDNIILFRDGVEVESDTVSEWDVLRLMMNKDGKTGVIDISSSETAGIIEDIITDNTTTLITINKVQYEVSKLYLEACRTASFNAVTLKKGLKATFVLDNKNRIVAVKNSSFPEKAYGYLVKAGRKSELSDKVQLKIFEVPGKMSIRSTAENVKVNGVYAKSFNAFEEAFGGEIQPQLILYKLNSGGEVSEIEKAVDLSNNPEGKSGYSKENFSLDAKLIWNKSGGSRPQWQTNTNVSGNVAFDASNVRVSQNSDWIRVSPKGDTPLFYVPYDKEDDSGYMFFWAYRDFYMFNRDTDIEIFDTIKYNENEPFKRLSAMVLYDRGIVKSPYDSGLEGNSGNTVNQYRHNIIVKSVNKELNEDGETVWRIIGITFDINTSNGNTIPEEFSGYFADKVYNYDDNNGDIYGSKGKTPADLQMGDIIWIGYKNPLAEKLVIDRFLIVGSVDKYSDPNTDNYKIYGKTAKNATPTVPEFSSIIGKVIYANGEEFIIQTKNFQGNDVFYCCNRDTRATLFYSFNNSNKKIYDSNQYQIQKGNQVLMITKNGSLITLAVAVDW